MPSLDWNKAIWARDYDWSEGGEEWSEAFGGSDMQWYGSLLPRIHRFVPAGHIVEIAPGFGRWTRYLLALCERLTAVDLSETCLNACRKRFAGVPHIEYVLNDGVSLAAIADDSVDVLFCYDSLVHVELDTLSGYVAQLRAKLRPDGIAFIHHSNALEAASEGCPPAYYKGQGHHRGVSVSAALVAAAAEGSGLVCPTQELQPIGPPAGVHDVGAFYLDCITTFAHPGSRWDRDQRRVRNRWYPDEASSLRAIAPLYGDLAERI
jgi:SAM-dependent methyltransferase